MSNPSQSFTLYPSPSVKISISMYEGTIDGDENQSFTYGDISDPNTPSPKTFTIYSSAPDDNYAFGVFTIEDDTNINYCHVYFDVTGNEYYWDARPVSGENADPLGQNTKNNGDFSTEFHVGHPMTNSGAHTEKYQELHEADVFLLDYNAEKKTMIFRGNQPLEAGMEVNDDQRVDFPNLHAYMKKHFESQVAGGAFPEAGEYVLHDISIMASAESEIYQEVASFTDTPDVIPTSITQNQWYPSTNYKTIDDTYKARFYMHSIGAVPDSAAAINTFTKTLKDWMDNPEFAELTNIYYFHCASGHDRTAICAISYLVQAYSDLSMSDAYIYGSTLAGSGATIIGTTTESSDKRRLFPSSTGAYNQTILNCINLAKGESNTLDELKSSDAFHDNPQYVEAGYPWE